MDEDICVSCGCRLTRDDIGFHKKMVNRGAEEYMCTGCLCDYFGITRERAVEMINNFKKSGCTLFE